MIACKQLPELLVDYDTSFSFKAYTDMRVRWCRDPVSKTLEMWLPDYLESSPEHIVDDVVQTVLQLISGRIQRTQFEARFSEILVDYFLDDEFILANQNRFLRRIRSLGSGKGTHHNLDDSVDRLKKAGLVTGVNHLAVHWSEKMSGASLSSGVFRTILIHKALDREDTPDYVIDFFVYDRLRKIEFGLVQPGEKLEFPEYPMKTEAEAWFADFVEEVKRNA